MKIKFLLYILLIIVTGSGCDVTPPSLDNTYDPNSDNFTGNPIGNINCKTLSEQSIELSWKDSSNFVEGYKIQRKINDGDFKDYKNLNRGDSSFIDDNLEIKDTYYYRILRLFDNNRYSASDVICIKCNLYHDKIKLIDNNVNSACISSDGNFFAYIKSTYEVHVRRLSDLTQILSKRYSNLISSFLVSNDGKYLFVSSGGYDRESDKYNYKIEQVEITTGQIVQNISLKNIPEKCLFAVNNDNSILVSYSGQSLIAWDLISGTEKKLIAGALGCTSMQFFNNDENLAVFFNGAVSLFDTKTWNIIKYFNYSYYGNNTHGWSSNSISPDGKYLISNGSDYFITVWDVENRNLAGVINTTGNFKFIWEKGLFITYKNNIMNVQALDDSYQLFPLTKINLGSGDGITNVLCSKKGDLLLFTGNEYNINYNMYIDELNGQWQKK